MIISLTDQTNVGGVTWGFIKKNPDKRAAIIAKLSPSDKVLLEQLSAA